MATGSGWAIWPGSPHPLGATWDGHGVNFALFSAHAERVEVCLFDASGRHEQMRIPLPAYTDQVWHGYLPDCRPGHLYGYRVYGPYEPEKGHRFNGNKLLLDPYARAIAGRIHWHDALFGYRRDSAREDLSFDRRDSARFMVKGVVTGATFPGPEDHHPRTPWSRTIIYEAHVAGLSRCHPQVPENQRGLYSGLVSEPILRHLQTLGITAVELLPVFPFLDEQHLVQKGLTNYWGYNPYAFFTPHPGYLGDHEYDAFKVMVRRFHDAGIEVILDVVFNHTAEGNHMGPTTSLKGIDNLSYYLTVSGNTRYYMDHTGCGNTLNVPHPRVMQMVMDSLRYWVTEMGVDGFRFDLALSLARLPDGYHPDCPFLAAVRQDPVLSQAKLIAEPWDLGWGGYQVGGFPAGWTEWNDRFRNTVRRFWRGDDSFVSAMATCVTGSSDLFGHSGRRPQASLNFITAHDGFTLHDLVSYNAKHNESNGEDNHDGTNDNLSWNCGTEGETANPRLNALRQRQKKNILATLLLSQGVPMLVAGDEMGRTQRGNNNAYCQDNTISWMDWSLKRAEDRELLEFTRLLVALRRAHPVFQRTTFFTGAMVPYLGLKDISWMSAGGGEMLEEEWQTPFIRCFGFHLGGATDEVGPDGAPVVDDRFLVLLNAHDGPVAFRLPSGAYGQRWRRLFDTARPNATEEIFALSSVYPLEPRSFVLLNCCERRRNLEPPRLHRVSDRTVLSHPGPGNRRKLWLKTRTQKPKRKRSWTKTKP
ncbi:MAG: glycogen operon protein GlgX [Rhodospirillaceae bacterium]|nr:MAG: glycogen operon protein GlgX [Rhodospirillaceae bacterium]